MCLYPTLRRNKKYEKNKKNGGIIPPVLDTRVLYVPTACGNCLECRKKKAREWTIRLQEDIKGQVKKRFITLTLSNESYNELYAISEKKTLERIEKLKTLGLDEHDKKKRLSNEYIKLRGYKKENEIITLAVRRFMERWRKEHKVSLRHWLVSELGGNGTENIHLHGIVYTDDLEKVEKLWKYGYVWKGKVINGKLQNYVNDRTINYMVKYISKIDFKHEYYKPIILNSAGIGANYEKSRNFEDNRYIAGKTNEMLRLLIVTGKQIGRAHV